VPRPTSGFFIYLTPIDFGFTYSLHAFSTGGDDDDGSYVGEPTVVDAKFARRGVTEEYFRAFAQNYRSTFPRVFGGVVSAVEGYIR